MSSLEAMKEFESHIDQLGEETKKLKQNILNDSVCVEHPQLHSDKVMNGLLHTKLKLESEIESLLNSDLKFLPEDEDVLLNLAKEDSQRSIIETNHTLDFQKEVNKKLEKQKKRLHELIHTAETVDSKLTNLIENRDEVDYIAQMKYKHNNLGIVFRELRDELSWYLNTRFPPPASDLGMSMEQILETVTRQFLADPNEAYVTFDHAQEEYLNFLIKANIIIRHPRDIAQFKLIDCR